MGECHGQDAHRQVLSGQQDSGKPVLHAGASSIGPDAVGSQLERDVTTAEVKAAFGTAAVGHRHSLRLVHHAH